MLVILRKFYGKTSESKTTTNISIEADPVVVVAKVSAQISCCRKSIQDERKKNKESLLQLRALI